MQNPRVETSLSIITVSAFDFQRLEYTLRSLVEFSDLKFEHITVLPSDDRDSILLWNQLCGHRDNFRLLHDENQGIYAAMNVGGGAASGKYLVFWNSGEAVTNRQDFHGLLEELKSRNSPQIVTQGEIEWIPSHHQNRKVYDDFIEGKSTGFISHQTYFLRLDEFHLANGFNQKYKVAADSDLMLRMSKREIDFIEHLRPISIQNSKYASTHNRRSRIENVFVNISHGVRSKNFIRFANFAKQELCGVQNRFSNIFEVSSSRLSWDCFGARKYKSKVKVQNFARSNILIIFQDKFLPLFDFGPRRKVAIIGGSKIDPEAKLLEMTYPSLEFTTFGIEDTDHYLDLNLRSQVLHEKFDAVLVSQVIEHVWNHDAFFENLATLVQDNGLVWLACPTSNKVHGSPDFFCSGLTSEYLALNLSLKGISEVTRGEFGTKRLYFYTHLIPGWPTRSGHAFPLLFAFEDRNFLIRTLLKFRFFGLLLLLSIVSPVETASQRWVTESWFIGRKLTHRE